MDNPDQEPRVLYCDIFAESLNPTATHTGHLTWTAFPDTRFYGPGYSSEKELDMGLARWAREKGPFDLIVLGPNAVSEFIHPGSFEASANFLTRYAVGSSEGRRIASFLEQLPDELERSEIGIRLISLLNLDYYGSTSDQIDRIKGHGFHVLSANQQFITRIADLPDFARQEKHYQRKEKKISDCFRDFLEEHPERVITALHFVLLHEFHFCAFDERKDSVVVPGIDYYKRRKATEELRASSVCLRKNRHLKFYKAADKLGLQPYGRFLSLKGYHHFYAESIRSNKYVYTSRGGFGFPVRKFFEIPAAGGLLICDPCTAFDALGYDDQRDYFFCEPEELAEMVSRLDIDEGSEVARSGQRVTWNLHSVAARGAQVRECVLKVLDGTYRGARWENGAFIVVEQ